MPAQLVDAAHAKGLVYSDRRGNCVFPCDKESGRIFAGNRPQPFKRTVGQGHLPYSLKGTDNKVFVTESAIDALTLKIRHPASAVIATGGNMPLERLKSYLVGKEIYLAQDKDAAGNAQAERLRAAFPDAQRITPPTGKDWNEHLQRQPQRGMEPAQRMSVDMER